VNQHPTGDWVSAAVRSGLVRPVPPRFAADLRPIQIVTPHSAVPRRITDDGSGTVMPLLAFAALETRD
jgi:hypothetical protein